MSFGNDISKWSGMTEEKLQKVVKMSFVQLSNNVISRSPVGNADNWKPSKSGKIYKPDGYTGGRFRANWQASINSPATGAIDTDEHPVTNEAGALASVKNVTRKFGDYYLMNNLPYAKRLEEGHSRQASDGIVKVAVANWGTIVRIMTGLVK